MVWLVCVVCLAVSKFALTQTVGYTEPESLVGIAQSPEDAIAIISRVGESYRPAARCGLVGDRAWVVPLVCG
jgi:hypothetical protein